MLKTQLLEQFQSLAKSKDTRELINLCDELDEFFGLERAQVKSVDKDHYPELLPHALNTSYFDYFNLLKLVPGGEQLVDLGAGAGRGSVLSCFLELAICISYEIEISRVDILRRALHKFSKSEFAIQGDLADLSFPKAKHYYLYFPRNKTAYFVLRELSHRDCTLYVCESHGDMFPFLSSLPALFERIGEIPLLMPRWENEIRIYKSKTSNTEVKIEDSLSTWFLRNFDSDKILIFKWKNPKFGEELELYLPVEHCDLEFFGKNIFIRNTISNRQYLIGSEVHVLRAVDKTQRLKSLFEYFDRGLKVFKRQNTFYVEQKTGVVEKLEC